MIYDEIPLNEYIIARTIVSNKILILLTTDGLINTSQ